VAGELIDLNLAAAYNAARYVVHLPDTRIAIHLGAANPQLDALGAWAWITAHNPGSRQHDAADNAARHQALGTHLRSAGWLVFDAYSEAPDGGWPREVGYLAVGADCGAALALARRFGQLAIVCGGPDQVAAIRWCILAAEGVGPG
jgi:hypothetical protein